jgi:hypothetical protein
MYRKIYAGILLISLTACSFVFAMNEADTAKQAVTKPVVKKSALIVNDSSKLEVSVTRILKDTLTKNGYSVKETQFTGIGKEKASDYTVSIVFSAINPGNEITPVIQSFINTKAGSSSRVILYTVYGTDVNKKDTTVDATSQATSALHPQQVADHILKSLKQ